MFKYPYGNLHGLNLDWLIDQWKKFQSSFTGSFTASSETLPPTDAPNVDVTYDQNTGVYDFHFGLPTGVKPTGFEIGYQASASGTAIPTGAWLANPPAVPSGQYLWSRTRVIYNDNQYSQTYAVSRQGVDGSGSPATQNPLMDGTVYVGSSLNFAREDHRHPSDTSRIATSALSNTTPQMDSGNGSSGTSVTVSRGDHVHPADSTKESVTRVKNISANKNKTVILIGDSYGTHQGFADGWQELFENLGIATVYKSAVGGSGLIGDPNYNNFLQQLQGITVSDPNTITDIILMGGYNDASLGYSEADLLTAMTNLKQYCDTTYPYAKVHFGCIAVDYNNTSMMSTIHTYQTRFKNICRSTGVAYITNSEYILLDRSKIYIDSGNPNSGFHPNTTGNTEISYKLAEYLFNGYFDVEYSEVIGTINFVVYVKNGVATMFPAGYALGNSLPAMTYPFNSWTLLIDLSTVSKLLWGTHSDGTTFKFWADVYTPTGLVAQALFRILDKQLYINPLNNTSGMVLANSGWICPPSITIPYKANY